MIIPIGHEHTTVRRLPWVTFSIMGLCVLVSIFTSLMGSGGEREAAGNLQQALEYFAEHPYLQLPERLYSFFEGQYGADEMAAEIEAMRELGPERPANPEIVAEEQRFLEDLVGEIYAALEQSPMWRWGLVPARFHVETVITHQFLHGGFWHLFGNLFLLFLAGPFIEDVWGRPLYGAFYIIAGVVAGLMFMVRYPQLDAPLIGASGAIAGVMGAFLVRYWSTNIRFFYWFGLVVRGTFEAPAWLMLPLWFFKELAYAAAMDTLAPGAGGGGVAFWAHVWGFGFGAVAAAVIAYLRIEEKYIHGSIESKVTLVDNTAVETASALAESGDVRGAVGSFERELAVNPDNVDAAMALWNLCFKHDMTAAAVPPMLRALASAVRRGDDEFVIAHWEDMLHACGNLPVEPALAVRMAELLERDRRDEGARDTVELAFRRMDHSTPAGLRLRLARLAITLEAPSVASVIDAALADPELPPDAREELGSARASEREEETTAASSGFGETLNGAIEVCRAAHTLQVVQAIPRRLNGSLLELEIDGRLRSIGLDSIQALAVGGIARSGERPIVLVDLLLDSPWGDRPQIRTVRLLSNAFDPRSLVAADNAMAAFQKLLDRLLDISEAVPLPDPDAARGRPFRSYPSIEAYQRDVLNVTG